jgi:threonine/homoserine/homoserine lactone efflux protein
MTSAMNHGIKKSLPHLLGIIVGFPVMFIATGLGLSTVFTEYPIIHEIIRIVGVFYLIFLAWIIATSTTDTLDGDKKKPFSFIQAALFQWVNPKAWILVTGAIATYTHTSSEITQQVFTMALIFLIVGTPSVGLWLVFGSAIRKILTKNLHQHIFNVTMSLLLLSSIIPTIEEMLSLYY